MVPKQTDQLWQEIYYYCGSAKKVDTTQLTKDGMSLEGTVAPDQQTLSDLTQEGGALHHANLPGADLANEDGEKALWDTAACAAKAKAKAKADPALKMTPKTIKEHLV